MAETYKAGKDVYAVIAQIIYNNNYEDNLEFKDGVLYLEGKKRRKSAKPILLGRPAKGLKSTIKLHYAPSWSNPCRITL